MPQGHINPDDKPVFDLLKLLLENHLLMQSVMNHWNRKFISAIALLSREQAANYLNDNLRFCLAPEYNNRAAVSPQDFRTVYNP